MVVTGKLTGVATGAAGTVRKKAKGHFFAIDRNRFQQVCPALGMNPGVAYLVLTRFSGHDNRVTSASVRAVETYTGISRGRAREAIHTLIASKIITEIIDNSFPKYDLLSGVVEPEWIFLPNELVTGATDETPPLEKVRQMGDPLILRLFIDLYSEQNLRENCGIDRFILLQKYEREKIGQQGEYDIYGFQKAQIYFGLTGPFELHKRQVTKTDKKAGINEGTDLSMRLERLMHSGLLEFVPHLFESGEPEAEPIHPCGMGATDKLEDQIGTAAYYAGLSLLTAGQREYVWKKDLWLVPVPRHINNVEMIGIARLTYRPKTRLTGAWWAELNSRVKSTLNDIVPWP